MRSVSRAKLLDQAVFFTDVKRITFLLHFCVSQFIYLTTYFFFLFSWDYIRSKNTVNILIKNWLDMCIAALVYWAVGFALTFGPSYGRFMGTSYFFFNGMPGKYWHYLMGIGPNTKKIPQNSGKQIRIPEGM